MTHFCRHYPKGGLGDNTHCTQGIEMQSVRDASVVPHRFPCFTVGADHLCTKYEPHTPEEIAEDERQMAAFLARLKATIAGTSKECAHCGQTIEEMHQVGRSVYAGPCGCRQYQGKLSKAWGGRS